MCKKRWIKKYLLWIKKVGDDTKLQCLPKNKEEQKLG